MASFLYRLGRFGLRRRWWGRRCLCIAATFGAVVVVLAATALGLALIGVGTHAARATMASSLALAMGIQAATARQLAVMDVSTVVVTSTLTGLAADSRLGAARDQPALRRAVAVVLIAAARSGGPFITSDKAPTRPSRASAQ